MDDNERSKFLRAFAEKPDILFRVAADGELARTRLEAERAKTTAWLDEQREVNKMRRQWSVWLLISIVGVIFFDAFFVLLLGFKWLFFENQKIVFLFLGEDLVKIAGLAYLVVNYLFDRSRNISP